MAVQKAPRRELMVSRAWVQVVGVVVLFGFLILGLLAYRTYVDEPPIPQQVVSASGQVLFTGAEISRGQQVFLGNGLMEYGSVFGHGAYLGPDFTADYLHRSATAPRKAAAIVQAFATHPASGQFAPPALAVPTTLTGWMDATITVTAASAAA